jgi:Tfp pilus assembly protein PilW
LALHRQQQVFRQIQTGSLALSYLIRDIENAGYRGCRSRDNAFPFYRQDSEFHSAYAFLRFDRAVSGFFAKAGACYGKLPESSCKRLKRDSSVLILYNIAQPTYRLKKPLADTRSSIEVDRKIHIPKNALVLISDCKQADVFIANRLVKDQIFHEKILEVNRNEHLSKTYDQDAEVLELQTVAYYVGVPERFKKKVPPPYYSLFRDDFIHQAVEVVTHINALEILYGLYHPETGRFIYLSAEALKENDWTLVQSVKITLVSLDSVTQHKKTWKAEIILRNRIHPHISQLDTHFNFPDGNTPCFAKSVAA